MCSIQAVVIIFSILLGSSNTLNLDFPPNFKFGASTSSYQIEGGWNAGGKGENMWDKLLHEQGVKTKDNSTGDVAADSYHQWREDVRIATELGLQFYRFSISWARVLPTGFPNQINTAGVRYYSNLIDALLDNGIEPVITLYHWELPVAIRDLGAWTNPLIVDWFGDYARVIFSLFSDRVKTWITINEAVSICDYSYNAGLFAPGIKEPEFGPYLCNKHVLLAHATAYRIYQKEFKPWYDARISFSNYELWIDPATSDDEELAELGRQHSIGRYSHPIYSKEGGWPPSIETKMLEYSLKQGYNRSRLPSFTQNEIEFIKGTSDFYSINHYSTSFIRPAKPGEDAGVWVITGSPELNAVLVAPPNRDAFGPFPLLVVYPKGIRSLLSWIRKQYGDMEIVISENGFSTSSAGLVDEGRLTYIKEYLEQVMISMKEDKVNVIGYSVWSLIDNFEWLDGFTTKFGLYEVDFEHPNRTRTPRKSAYYYSCVIKNRSLNITDEECFDEKYIANKFKIKPKNGGRMPKSCGFIVLIFIFIINL